MQDFRTASQYLHFAEDQIRMYGNRSEIQQEYHAKWGDILHKQFGLSFSMVNVIKKMLAVHHSCHRLISPLTPNPPAGIA